MELLTLASEKSVTEDKPATTEKMGTLVAEIVQRVILNVTFEMAPPIGVILNKCPVEMN